MADINLQVGAGSKFGAINLLDNTNNNSIPATFSNVSVSNSSPSVATVEPNPPSPNQGIRATPITAGTGTAIISVLCNYTDPGDNQLKSETLTITKTFEVLAAPHGAHLQINFP